MVMAVVSIILGSIFPEGHSDSEEGVSLPGWVDGVAILATVVIVALVGSFNNWFVTIIFFFLLLLL
jgi:hypothetical protein